MDSDRMPHPLQEKDAQWRRRGHGARPIFDPGMAPAGADEEAGGARSVVPADTGPADPLPTEPVFQPGGPRLTPRFWYGCAAAIGLLMLVLGFLSL